MQTQCKRAVCRSERYIFEKNVLMRFQVLNVEETNMRLFAKCVGSRLNETMQPLQLASGATRAPQEDDASSPSPSPLAAGPVDLDPPSPSQSEPRHVPSGLDGCPGSIFPDGGVWLVFHSPPPSRLPAHHNVQHPASLLPIVVRSLTSREQCGISGGGVDVLVYTGARKSCGIEVTRVSIEANGKTYKEHAASAFSSTII